jgi:hypothetical protein
MADETGWLLEKQDKGSIWFIGVIDGMLGWTTDPDKALRLCRRDDAEAIATICEDAERISEHLWPDVGTPSKYSSFEEWWISREAEITPEKSLSGHRPKLSILAAAAWNAALDVADERCDCNACNFEELYAK